MSDTFKHSIGGPCSMLSTNTFIDCLFILTGDGNKTGRLFGI